ncbi:DPY30 domain-containing protein 2 [Manis javanica]|nr:DPY30 domain-containing protein 2 [Manis javanica]
MATSSRTLPARAAALQGGSAAGADEKTEPTGMETDYLKRCFGNCLAQALADVAKVRPSDPIEYLAHWLYHYRKSTKAKEEPLVSVASSTKEVIFTQENINPLETEAFKQESLPGPSECLHVAKSVPVSLTRDLHL